MNHLDTDILVIGAGGAGLRASLAALHGGARVTCISKVQATRSHTVAAKGGINAALGNRGPDDWRWHMYDTIRGSDWLGDQDAIEVLCRHAKEAIIELEGYGMPFTRDESGKIYQRAYGGQSTDYGKGGLAYRACAVADRTGHVLLHTLHQQALKAGLSLREEWIVLDLLMDDNGCCRGALAWELATGDLHRITARVTILATGGFGQLYAHTTASNLCTGDGNAFALRAGLPVQDMEFIQFHPTGLYGSGCLITEGARSEGGKLLNGQGERFMERYAPAYGDLASRDIISRAIMQEIQAGRGAGEKKDHALLDVTHLAPEMVREKIPAVFELAQKFAGVDATKQPIPVLPCAHYTMGGVPANWRGEVLNPTESAPNRPVPGLMVVGEAACQSVHGANRLGCNSLLDLVVFGKIAGEHAAHIRHDMPTTPWHDDERALVRFEACRNKRGTERVQPLTRAVQQVMHEHVSIFRTARQLQAGEAKLAALWERFRHTGVQDKSRLWNLELLELLELENLLLQASATLHSALYRTESRGAHYREDYPKRNDAQWLKHTLARTEGQEVRLSTRPVIMTPRSDEVEPVRPETRSY